MLYPPLKRFYPLRGIFINKCNINAINMNIIPIFVVYLVFLTNY